MVVLIKCAKKREVIDRATFNVSILEKRQA